MRREKALSAAAEDGCISSTNWQALDQRGRSLSVVSTILF